MGCNDEVGVNSKSGKLHAASAVSRPPSKSGPPFDPLEIDTFEAHFQGSRCLPPRRFPAAFLGRGLRGIQAVVRILYAGLVLHLLPRRFL